MNNLIENHRDPIVNELRSIELREIALEEEKAKLRRRKLQLLDLDQGARKSGRDMLSPAQGKALFAKLKGVSNHEHGKAR
ncbi:hypothetical protein [uncultured Desulfovibrio sp.]|jgi:hypothetical protein|uniref:hypothetical protein n=1 Tax=uncultured Desulfovibrio sp. TaxID=167968 RepID=UPI002586EB3A|nr:hypothetical protein [uncultured Desulfovibrio sp.]